MKLQTARSDFSDPAVLVYAVSLPKFRSYPWITAMYSPVGALLSSHHFTKLSYLGHRYAGDVFKEYFSGRIDSIRASEMLGSKIDHLPKLESTFYRGVK